MKTVLTQRMVVGHVMRYPGEVVEIQEPGDRGQESVAMETTTVEPLAEDAPPATTPRRKGRKP